MNRYVSSIITVTAMVMSSYAAQVYAEARGEAGGSAQANKKAQYMIRQLHNEKQELQATLAELQAKYDTLLKEHDKTKVHLEKSSTSNDLLASRVKGTSEKYNELAEKYREAVSILKKASLDNQYMVRAVQEREQWMNECTSRNENLYHANSNLLAKYGEVAAGKAEPFIGLGIVEVENEVQEYRFRLEDLQVTKFKPTVDASSHSSQSDQSRVSEAEDDAEQRQRLN